MRRAAWAGLAWGHDELAGELGVLRSRAWQLLREFNASPGSVSADLVLESARTLEAAVEVFRRVFYPRARSVVVACDTSIGQPLEVWTMSPTGRGRLVYSLGRD